MKLFLYSLFIISCYSYSIEQLQIDIKDVIEKMSQSDEYLTHYINAPPGYDFVMHGNTPQYFPIVEPEIAEPEIQFDPHSGHHSTIRMSDLCAIGESFNPGEGGCVPTSCSSKRACLDYQRCISRPNKICSRPTKTCKKFKCVV